VENNPRLDVPKKCSVKDFADYRTQQDGGGFRFPLPYKKPHAAQKIDIVMRIAFSSAE